MYALLDQLTENIHVCITTLGRVRGSAMIQRNDVTRVDQGVANIMARMHDCARITTELHTLRNVMGSRTTSGEQYRSAIMYRSCEMQDAHGAVSTQVPRTKKRRGRRAKRGANRNLYSQTAHS